MTPIYLNRVKSKIGVWLPRIFDPKKVLVYLIPIILLLMISPVLLTVFITNAYSDQQVDKIEDIQEVGAGLVFNQVVSGENKENALKQRILDVSKIYENKLIKRVYVLSSDPNSLVTVSRMTSWLEELGVPSDKVVSVEGFSSIREACSWLEQEEVTEALIVSQHYSLSRSMYVCISSGVKTSGYISAAKDFDYSEDIFQEILQMPGTIFEVLR